MEIFRIVSFPILGFVFILTIIAYDKCQKLEKQLKKIKRQQKGDRSMSRLITNLIGQKVNIVMEDGRLEWEILDVDGDWVYLERTDKKGNRTEKYIPIDAIYSIERLTLLNEGK